MMNYFPYIAGFSCTFALFSYLFKLLRVYRKVEVNCWFCNSNTKVEYSNSNSFICPFCDQYNGFKEDGGYNCIIPAQHAESYNYSSRLHYKNSSWTPKLDEKFNNGFCESCNLNQALKIRAIAEYSSVSSNDNDEVENFQEKLEEIYSLCQQCKATLHQTLGKQNSWLKPLLISWKLMQSKEKALKSSLLKSNTNSCSIFRKLLVFSCVLMCILRVGSQLDWFEPYETLLKIISLDFKWIYQALMLLAVLFQCCFIMHQKIKFKYIFSFIGWAGLVSAEWNSAFTIPSEIMYYQIAFNILNLIFVLWITGLISSASGIQRKNKKDRPKKGKSSNDLTFFTSPAHVPASKDDSFISSNTNISTEESPSKIRKTETDDLDDNLLSLKISTPQKSKNSESFSPKNLFKENSSCRKIDCGVLQPSKFGKHFITQASWVAGGYWGSPGSPQRGRLTSQNVSNFEENRPKPVFSLSRSSSQSSGFVSQYSDCPSSKSHSNLFSQIPKPYSPRSSLASDPVEKGSIYSFNRSPSSRATPISPGHPHSLDFADAHSACSASSFLSDNSQLHHRASTLSGSYVHDTRPLSLTNEVWPNEQNYNCKMNYISSYFNVGVAFLLGLSVSANIFLLILLFQ